LSTHSDPLFSVNLNLPAKLKMSRKQQSLQISRHDIAGFRTIIAERELNRGGLLENRCDANASLAFAVVAQAVLRKLFAERRPVDAECARRGGTLPAVPPQGDLQEWRLNAVEHFVVQPAT
jgi:hypothetical protein